MHPHSELQKARITGVAKNLLGEKIQIHFVTSGSWLSFEIASTQGSRLALGMTKTDAAEKKTDGELTNWLGTLLGPCRKAQPARGDQAGTSHQAAA
jgi:hypothetical protein